MTFYPPYSQGNQLTGPLKLTGFHYTNTGWVQTSCRLCHLQNVQARQNSEYVCSLFYTLQKELITCLEPITAYSLKKEFYIIHTKYVPNEYPVWQQAIHTIHIAAHDMQATRMLTLLTSSSAMNLKNSFDQNRFLTGLETLVDPR